MKRKDKDGPVADSEAIRLPTLKELIGYPTTYDYTVTVPSVFSHLPRFDVDNDISRQVVEESELDGANDPLDPSSEVVEESGDSWLRQASESKVRSRATQSKDNPEERTSVTNVIQEDENKPGRLSTTIYLKPTTMRGIPLASLTSSSVTRGFYVTKSDDDFSSTWTEDFTSSYSHIEQQTEMPDVSTTDVSTTDEVVTVAHNNQSESESTTIDNHANDIINEHKDDREVKFTFDSSTVSSEDSSSVENTTDYEEPEATVSFIDDAALKKGKSLPGFGRGRTSFPNAPVVSPTTPTRRAIALAVSRYNDLTTPLWTGRRIVVKKRIRTTVSPIRDAIRRTDDGFLRSATNVFGGDSVISTPIMTRRFSVIPTIPTISAISSETSDVYENFTGSTAEAEDLRTRATTEATITLTTDSSIAERDPLIASTSSDFEDLTLKITEDPMTLTTPTDVTDDSPAVMIDDSTITTTFTEDETTFVNANYTVVATDPTTAIASDPTTIAAGETPASTTANYLAITIPARASTHAMEADSTSTGLENATSMVASHSATDTPAIKIIDPIITTYKPVVTSATGKSASMAHSAIPKTTSVHEIVSDSEPTTVETTSTKAETISTVVTYFANTIPTVQEEHSTKTVPETIISWTMPPTEIVDATASISTVVNYSANIVPTTIQEEHSTTAPETTTWITPTEVVTASTIDTDSTTIHVITTTESATIIPATSDFANAVTASAGANVTSTVTSTTADSSWTTTDFESSVKTSSELPVTNTEPISMSSTGAVTSTTESSTISFAASTIRDIDVNVDISGVTETKESAHTTEIPTTFETSPRSPATTIAVPKSLASTDSKTSTARTASFTQAETSVTPTATQTPSILVPIANTATEAFRKSTVFSSIPATFHESVATNAILETTAKSTYETNSARTTSEEPIKPELKTVSEKTAAKSSQNRTRGRTRSELAAIGHEFGRRTSGRTVIHRRVINRPSNGDVETPTTRQPTRQYPRRRVTVYRSRKPYYTSSSRVVEENRRRRIIQKRLRTSSEATSNSVRFDENIVDVQNDTREYVMHDRIKVARRRTKVLKRVRERVEKEETSTSFAEETMVLGESSNLDGMLRAYHEDTKTGRRREIVPKRIKPQTENNLKEEANEDTDSPDKSSPGRLQSVLHTSGDEEDKMRRKIVVWKRLKSKSEERNSTTRSARVNFDFNDKNSSYTLPTNLRANNSLPDEGNTKRKLRVVLLSIKPVSKERNATKETNADPDVIDENLQSNFSGGARAGKNLFGKRTSRRMRTFVVKRPKPERENTASEDSDSTGDDLQGNFSSNLYVNDDLPDSEKKTTRSKPGEEETTTSEQPNAEPRATEATSVRVEEDTDRPSHEVNTWTIDGGGSVSRKLATRQRISTTTHSTTSTTAASLTNTLSSASTTHRRSRPFAESTLSSRIDLVDPYDEFTEQSYVKPAGVEVDQKADVSDQSIRAQEFAVTLADPPSSSSSGTGYTQLRNAVRRKISTTIAPRTDPTSSASRTVSKYDGVSRSRQGSKTKDRPTVNATTRPRRPPVVDYDYYEDEVPVVVGKALVNGKLFLTSKGTIHCLDQGNFPHPYSCKKFITCARMVNGQVIGTEYTCPAKLSFDPVGGICNWSAGLGCKD